MVVPSPLGWEPIPARPRRPWHWVFGVGAVLVVAFLALNAIPASYYALAPGDALPADGPSGAVTVRSVHAGSGNLFLATVALQNRVSLWDRVLGKSLDPNITLVPKKELTGGVSTNQYLAQSQQEMSGSQLAAKVAALRRLGYQVPERGDGALVADVGVHTPADGQVQQGDVIKVIDGQRIMVATEATSVIRSRRAGDTVSLEVSRPGLNASPAAAVHLSVRTVACGTRCPGDAARAFVGVSLVTDKQTFGLPPSVGLNIATDNIGGPSAGLAFTLGAIDALTPSHNLTGGHRVAVTGPIDVDGTVGEVGGVTQKTVAVEQQHCQYFLVPPSEYVDAQAKARGHHLTVVRVSTLDDALVFLRTIGGDLSAVPATPTGASP